MDKKKLAELAIASGFDEDSGCWCSGISDDDRMVHCAEYPCGEALFKFAGMIEDVVRKEYENISPNGLDISPVTPPDEVWIKYSNVILSLRSGGQK